MTWVFGEKCIGGLTKIIYRSMSTIYIGGLSTKLFIGVSPLLYIRGLSTKLFIGVCPLLILEGCPQIKQIHSF